MIVPSGVLVLVGVVVAGVVLNVWVFPWMRRREARRTRR